MYKANSAIFLYNNVKSIPVFGIINKIIRGKKLFIYNIKNVGQLVILTTLKLTLKKSIVTL